MKKKQSRTQPHVVVGLLDVSFGKVLKEAEAFAVECLASANEPQTFKEVLARQVEDGALPAISSRAEKALEIKALIRAIREARREHRWDDACLQCVALGTYWSSLDREPQKQEPRELELTKALKAFCLRRMEEGFSPPSVTKARAFVKRSDELRPLVAGRERYIQSRSFDQQWLKIKKWCIIESSKRHI